MDVPNIVAERYRIEREIGSGGMGTVYCATHLGLERPVAVKILKPEFAAYPAVAERFMREARTMAKLRHARAAVIFDAGRLADGRPFIVMEYVEGITLADMLARDHTFAPERAVCIATEICDVLAEAHRLGIVHRDLKPSNIMLNNRGVCVLDFGIAKVLATSADATRTHATTEAGMIIGTPRYMSPEQCMGQMVGPASDLYSLGVLIYEMLAGRPPFIDALSSAVIVRQASSQPPPLPTLCPGIPRSLALAVHTLLAKNPSNRPATAEEASLLLNRSITKQSLVASTVMPFASTIALLNHSRSVAARALTCATVIAMFGALLLVWARSEPSAHKNRLLRGAPSEVSSTTATTGNKASLSRAQPIPLASAHRIAASLVNTSIDEAHIARTLSGWTIAALYTEPRTGAAHLSVVEQRNARYRVTARTPLDAASFHNATWTAETKDVDGDGWDEVLCTGTNMAGRVVKHRLLLYIPRTRQTFSVRIEANNQQSNRVRLIWPPSAFTQGAAPFRTALRQRALSLLVPS
ncbi:MAG: serine/threonine protein kinase [Pyrinomonadaceae bacterium]|nr:serine/threonine protein kinase [Pyrinomonadaceae bacterium]